MSLPLATHQGHATLGKWRLLAFNLSDGRRLFDKSAFLEVLNVPANSQMQAEMRIVGKHPLLRSHKLRQDSEAFHTPVKFKSADGRVQIGFEAEGLVSLCKFLLKARELHALRTQRHLLYAQAAEALLVSLANVGLAALIDEATGFQKDREHDALQALLERYIRKELAAWVKRFPDEFYEQLSRLKHWTWRGRGVNPPQVVGKYTRDIVYERLAPGVIDELERKNPATRTGCREYKHHQWLTDDVGHPALAMHLHAVIALMKVSSDWHVFLANLQDAFPKTNDQFQLDFGRTR